MTTLGISGHQGIPVEGLAFIRAGLARAIAAAAAPVTGYSSLAQGADQLFADAVLAAGGRLVAVIPSLGYEATFPDAAAQAAYAAYLAQAETVIVLDDHPAPTEQAFYDAGLTILDHCGTLLAVWDGQPARGFGGTADIVAAARERGLAVEVIWPEGLTR
jgi:hypothetical protein